MDTMSILNCTNANSSSALPTIAPSPSPKSTTIRCGLLDIPSPCARAKRLHSQG
uniref:Uncharacterized protein n=1 Tax=Arundo donax TaxID=35708 RepID=A0A0A8XQ48_ARUDO